jgi:predicted Rossmann fold flavoprotein
MAAIHAAQHGATTTVLEANAQAGRKLLVTGGGRCNFTHAAGPDELVRAFGPGGRFLRHSFHEMPPVNVQTLFQHLGVPSRVEADGCVFPASDQARDIRDLLVRHARKLGVQFRYRQPAQEVTRGNNAFVIRTGQHEVMAVHVIIATGGVTWPQTGSTGDGYRFATALGHTVNPPRASLVPLVTREQWVCDLAGISLVDVRVRTRIESSKIITAGGLVFTHEGVGGPAVLDLSRHVADCPPSSKVAIEIAIDLAPGIDRANLDRQIQAQSAAGPKKTLANALPGLLPHRLTSALCRLAKCDPKSRAGQLTKGARRRLVALMKELPLQVIGTRPLAEATITHGGVCIAEIDPRTMASRLCAGLFFAGEVIDADGPCGGYNLQMCWSSGALAGRSAAQPSLE